MGTLSIDKLKVDDPVGAVAVHGINGVFGTIAVGLFDLKDGLFATGNTHLLMIQMMGTVIISVWGLVIGYGLAKALKVTVGSERVLKRKKLV